MGCNLAFKGAKEPNHMFQLKIPQLNPMRPTQNMKGTENLYRIILNTRQPSKRISKQKENN
jgi:hypothetical protein